MKGLAFIYKRLLPYNREIVTILLFMGLPLCFGIMQPILFGKFVDLISSNQIKDAFFIVFLIFIVCLMNLLFNLVCKYKVASISYKIQFSLKTDLIKRIFFLPMNIFESLPKGELINKVENDTKAFSIAVTDLAKFLVDSISFIFIIIILIKINLKLSLILVLLGPILLISFLVFGKKIKFMDTIVKRKLDSYLNLLNETLEKFTLFRVFHAEGLIFRKFEGELSSYQSSSLKKNRITILSSGTVEGLNFISYIAILLGGLYYIGNHNLTLGELVAFTTYSSNFNYSLLRFSQFNVLVQETVVSINRMDNIPAAASKNSNENGKYHPKSLTDFTGTVMEISNLSYSYAEVGIRYINELTVSVSRSKILQITGANGSGKSTLLKILAGLYRNYTGEIRYKGSDINDIPRSVYCNEVCFVTQEPQVISGSIRENLLLGNAQATSRELRKVCEMVGIASFIDSLDHHYNTLIGINGIELSVGQKQKLSMARGLLVNAELYLFDEVTSALDAMHKQTFFELMHSLKENNKAIIIISHDPLPPSLVDEKIELCI
ncbi:ABC transporter ATP-binding protein [Paenibacillus sp. OK076]|uniref:ABC transporter transmembrane domain-containing protein n=1 Tax=Paenibacillus sp. OK076 TaxID=1884379 RepID=UPI0008AE3A31|nr:ABC transporter ATP-binding protein [Paenibacillus sp. OK076]SEM76645.1 ABC-type bacteriocin/lantibiotic exporter, contains an N-terminal double-glycine peptidase domain [Paenibacillus sp. OK076]